MQKELQSARFLLHRKSRTFFLFNEIPNPIFQQEIITEYLHKIRNLYTIFILKILSLIYKTGEEKQ